MKLYVQPWAWLITGNGEEVLSLKEQPILSLLAIFKLLFTLLRQNESSVKPHENVLHLQMYFHT